MRRSFWEPCAFSRSCWRPPAEPRRSRARRARRPEEQTRMKTPCCTPRAGTAALSRVSSLVVGRPLRGPRGDSAPARESPRACGSRARLRVRTLRPDACARKRRRETQELRRSPDAPSAQRTCLPGAQTSTKGEGPNLHKHLGCSSRSCPFSFSRCCWWSSPLPGDRLISDSSLLSDREGHRESRPRRNVDSTGNVAQSATGLTSSRETTSDSRATPA
jgi:hypothetical protein